MKLNLPYIILIGIILIMGYFLIFNQPAPVVESFDEAPLQEEIRIQDSSRTYWKYKAAVWQTEAERLESKSDSLQNLKPSIKIYYEKKYTFNANATVHQLDSIIRSNW